MSPAVRLGCVAMAVGGAFGGAAVVGSAVGPIQMAGVGGVGGPPGEGAAPTGRHHAGHADQASHVGHKGDVGQSGEVNPADSANETEGAAHTGHTDEAVDADTGSMDHGAPADQSNGGHAGHGSASVGGVTSSQDGYTLEPEETTLNPGAGAAFRFRITGPDGAAVQDFELNHERELHLVLVGRNLTSYAHVHPSRDLDGTWSVELPALEPGSYRGFADFVVAGGPAMTLSVDLLVPGVVPADAVPEPWPVASVDGYEVTLAGAAVAGQPSELTVTVERDGVAVTDLEPYLGALGHLVAIRSGDLGYVHAHPGEATEGGQGPIVPFEVVLPSAGRYRLFFEFAHEGTVHMADFTIDAARAEEGA